MLLVTGAGGQVGRLLTRDAAAYGAACRPFERSALDVTDRRAVERVIAGHAAAGAVLINLAAYTDVERAETEPERAYRVNAEGVENLARACAAHRVPLVHISTDYVFDGILPGEYAEDAPMRPLGVYGASKAAGEHAVRAALADHLIIRTSWVFSATGRNFVTTMLRLAARDGEVRVVVDEEGCPTAAASLAGLLLRLALRAGRGGFKHWGTYHYCGAPPVSRAAFAQAIFEEAGRRGGLPLARVHEITSAQFPTAAPRPPRAVLSCDRIAAMFAERRPDWREDLRGTLAEIAAVPPAV